MSRPILLLMGYDMMTSLKENVHDINLHILGDNLHCHFHGQYKN